MSAKALSLSGDQTQRVLRLYHLYRLAIGITLVLLISSNLDGDLLELANADLFRTGCWVYLIVNIMLGVLLNRPEHAAQIFSLAMADVVMLSALFYAGGGAPSGIGNLLVASVAISNVLLRGRIGLLIAAVATIGIIYLTFYLSFSRPSAANYYVQAGTLGVLSFAAALTVQTLTRRLDRSETLANERAADVDNLEELNALILQRMRTGILVINARRQVLLANQGALTLLGHEQLIGQTIDDYSPQLVDRLRQWLINPMLRPHNVETSVAGPVLRPSFIALNRGDQRQTLVFLEDLSEISQQAQQLKLAALGRLTAGIAHEIRNPLAGIAGVIEIIGRDLPTISPARAVVKDVRQEIARINHIV
ncbi:histidine kinase dimerization/phospho-acceptor domain-containing protein, partial [Pseudomonas sp.]|uniref:histidine kinase dimerization/phospho-acceptor domain-containing protein n=1 Tax=Pseudomonas sp. TaxID=306 RepID=UPI0026374414